MNLLQQLLEAKVVLNIIDEKKYVEPFKERIKAFREEINALPGTQIKVGNERLTVTKVEIRPDSGFMIDKDSETPATDLSPRIKRQKGNRHDNNNPYESLDLEKFFRVTVTLSSKEVLVCDYVMLHKIATTMNGSISEKDFDEYWSTVTLNIARRGLGKPGSLESIIKGNLGYLRKKNEDEKEKINRKNRGMLASLHDDGDELVVDPMPRLNKIADLSKKMANGWIGNKIKNEDELKRKITELKAEIDALHALYNK